ncbi:MAG TPA: sugar phosphate nucleotidyltransferase [Candidatus Saccharimonadales bacterium]|nr:sugar phosphate nucleotidyltransferase [Candidatus Saccharimonadales bacterium]
MNCTKAIIPMAGYGTRRLPITKAIDKCMLPVGNRPIVDYVVEDCVKAGVTDIIFVVGEQFDQLQQFYGRNLLLEEYLRNNGKTEELQAIIDLAEKANFHYVVQDQHQPYGTAVPVALCADLIKEDEQVLVLMGDDFIYNRDGSSEVARLLNAAEQAGVAAGMLAVEVPREDVHLYGVVRTENGVFKEIVEKPKTEDAPSNLINISKYLFDKEMLNYARDIAFGHTADGERYVTEALNRYVQAGKNIVVQPVQGDYLDGGSTDGWLHANNVVIGAR